MDYFNSSMGMDIMFLNNVRFENVMLWFVLCKESESVVRIICGQNFKN